MAEIFSQRSLRERERNAFWLTFALNGQTQLPIFTAVFQSDRKKAHRKDSGQFLTVQYIHKKHFLPFPL